MFKNRALVIATKHNKEQVIAPILENQLGVKCFTIPDLDTDQLGTFTGEIDREFDPISTARRKCVLAMELSNCDLAVASEGSFGSHPTLFFAAADDEFLLLLDSKNNLEIVVRELSTTTNFLAETLSSIHELDAFLERALFTSHAVIVRKAVDDFSFLHKGITNREILFAIVETLLQDHESFYIETDMRAMFNPTRMEIIAMAAQKLAEKALCLCPNCSAAGFGITTAIKGLPCKLCSFPTRSVLSYKYTCQKCNFSNEVMYPLNKQFEDPTFCDFCNP
jgi:hypothetical protein